MYGYVYITRNKITGELYIGKHKSRKYDKSYYGSGKIILSQLEKYGKSNFTNEILASAETKEELDELERVFIKEHIEKYGTLCMNIAPGGDGGDTFSRKPDAEKDEFRKRMTKINRARCTTPEFRSQISAANRKRYSDPAARKKQSERVKTAWADPALRKQQSESRKRYYAVHGKDMSYIEKPCVMELNGITTWFESVKLLREHLIKEYGYNPDRRTFKRLMEDGAKGIPFKPFHKTKLTALTGMRIYYDPAGRKCRGQG